MKIEPFSPIPLLDLRPSKQFVLSHIIDSANFPVAELAERLHELPMRSQTINLFGTYSQLESATEFLLSKGYTIGSKQIVTSMTLQQLNDANRLAFGESYQRLWQPAPIVRKFIEIYGADCKNKNGLDLACGSGRDSVYLSMNGWTMTGIDYLPSALKKLSDLAIRCKQKIKTLQLDLEKIDPKEMDHDKKLTPLSLLTNTYDCVVVVRYLHRPDLQALKQLIDVGGFIVYQTFMSGCEKFGSPKNPRFLLKSGELADIFSDFDILLDEIEYLSDGRPTNCFIAKRVK